MAKQTSKQFRNRFNGAEIVRWVVDRHARRVPTFVIETTGLKTKAKIVASPKYGFGAVFDKTERGTAKLVRRGERV
jgi:hypothetical protein